MIDGGEGNDAAYYAGPSRDYEVVHEGETIIVTAKMGNEGRDELINIERLIFTDATVKVP